MTDQDDEYMPDRRIVLPESVLKILREANAEELKTGDKEERRPTTPHLSFSQMSMYLRCSMQYHFRYREGLKERPKVSLAIGKGGHAALEKNMKRKIKSGKDSPVEQVVQWASDFMDKELSAIPPSEMEPDVRPGETKDKFIAATKVFQVRDAPTIKPIAVEMEFNLDVNEFNPYPLEDPIRIINGKVDLIYDDTGNRVYPEKDRYRAAIKDNKYVTRKRSQTEVNLSPQLTLYASAFKKATGKWPTELGYIQLHPGTKSDAPDAIPLNREPEHMTAERLEGRMRRIAFQMRQVEHGIRNEVFVPTDDPITCSWCGFRDRCQDSLVTDFEAAILRQKSTSPA